MFESESLQTILLIFFVVVGIGTSVIYYFARYYFRTHDGDNEVVPNLKPAEEKSSLTQPLEVAHAPTAVQKNLNEALKNTKSHFFGRILAAVSGKDQLSADDLEQIEEVLYTSDLGPVTVERLMSSVQSVLSGTQKGDPEMVRLALKREIEKILSDTTKAQYVLSSDLKHKPHVILVVGVNGVGKTTTIGKVAHLSQKLGHKTLVVAGDTFRAAAREQLTMWSERASVEIFNPENVSEPAAVAYSGIEHAKKNDFAVVIVDTAGRLHTQDNLMAELQKVKRVIGKAVDGAPHETLLVIDANSGQNALIQAKNFHQTLQLSGVVLTKLDGTAKGGVAVGLASELHLPIHYVGIGEGLDDLKTFNTQEFVDSII